MDDTSSQRKKLPTNPSLEHLQKQAKDRAKENPSLKLAAAQHQIAQEYGFKNWAELARAVKKLSAAPPKAQPIWCEQCGMREATVNWSTIVAKKKVDQNLCAECAAARGLVPETQTTTPAPHGPVVLVPHSRVAFLDGLWKSIIQRLHLTTEQRTQAVNLWRRARTEVRAIRADDKMDKSARIIDAHSAVLREFTSLLSNEKQNEFHYLYSQSFRPMLSTAASARQNIRELELRLTDTDDVLRATLTLTRELLLQNNTIWLRLNFRGHEMARTEIGLQLLKKAVAQLEDIAQPQFAPKLIGRNGLVILIPNRPPPEKSTAVG